jgi:uncharacterized protein (DUF488 family)
VSEQDNENSLWSIGHSNIQFEKFADLILSRELELIADVRSTPFSKYTPQFNTETLRLSLRKIDVDYRFMGDSLGGRPPEPDLYDPDGHVRYDLVSKHFRFLQGLEELCLLSGKQNVAMMCSEESPQDCHRRLLIGRVLLAQGIDVLHIHGNGEISKDSSLVANLSDNQLNLFGEEKPWRSIQPVLRPGRQNNFLTP